MGTIMCRPACSLAPGGADVEAVALVLDEGSGTPFLGAGAPRGSGARSGDPSLVSMDTGTFGKEFSTEREMFFIKNGLQSCVAFPLLSSVKDQPSPETTITSGVVGLHSTDMDRSWSKYVFKCTKLRKSRIRCKYGFKLPSMG